MSLGNTKVTATGGPPATNYVVIRAAGVADAGTASWLPGALAPVPQWTWWRPGRIATVQDSTSEPTTIAKKGWVLGQSGGAINKIIAIDAGTWEVRIVIPAVTWVNGVLAVGFRAYQVAADMSSSTVIPLTTPTGGTAGANGWEYSAGAGLSATVPTTFLLTMTGVAAVSFAGATPFLYVEWIAKTTTDGVTAANATITSLALGTAAQPFPAITYSLSASDSIPLGAEALTRQAQNNRPISESIPIGVEALTRVGQHPRPISESIPIGAEALSRQFTGTRPALESIPIGAEALTRQVQNNRPTFESIPIGAEHLTRIGTHPRSTFESIPIGVENLSRVENLNRPTNESIPIGAEALNRQVRNNRATSESIPIGAEILTRQEQLSRTAVDNLASSAVTVVSPVFLMDE